MAVRRTASNGCGAVRAGGVVGKTQARRSREDAGSAAHSEKFKAQVLRAYHERTSLRGLQRIFGVSRQTVTAWLKKANQLPPLEQTLLPAVEEDELELDELWSFVKRRKNKKWLWLALCRRTRQIVAYVLGNRGEATCRRLWRRIPQSYKHSLCYSDFWAAYAAVVPPEQLHRSEKKGSTNHIERWNNTLRQPVGRLVRKTLSFSKTLHMHDIATQFFIHHYNEQRSISLT